MISNLALRTESLANSFFTFSATTDAVVSAVVNATDTKRSIPTKSDGKNCLTRTIKGLIVPAVAVTPTVPVVVAAATVKEIVLAAFEVFVAAFGVTITSASVPVTSKFSLTFILPALNELYLLQHL